MAPSISSIDNSGHRVGAAAVAVLSRMMRSEAARKNPPAIRVKPGEVILRRSTETYAFAQYFCRMFKADTGLTAERWREQNRRGR